MKFLKIMITFSNKSIICPYQNQNLIHLYLYIIRLKNSYKGLDKLNLFKTLRKRVY